jgi:gas vesicle protein
MSVRSSWKTRTILGGALVGAFAGLAAAYLLTQRAEREGRETAITPGEGVKLGVLVLGLLRAIASLGNEK